MGETNCISRIPEENCIATQTRKTLVSALFWLTELGRFRAQLLVFVIIWLRFACFMSFLFPGVLFRALHEGAKWQGK